MMGARGAVATGTTMEVTDIRHKEDRHGEVHLPDTAVPPPTSPTCTTGSALGPPPTPSATRTAEETLPTAGCPLLTPSSQRPQLLP